MGIRRIELEGRPRIVRQFFLPDVEIGCSDLVITSALQHEDRALQSGSDLCRIIITQVEKVRTRNGRAEKINGRIGLKRLALDLGRDRLGFFDLLLVLGRLRRGETGNVLNLVDYNFFDWPGG